MTKIATPSEVRDYWLKEMTPKDWYIASDVVDREITRRFLTTWQAARDAKCHDWLLTPEDLLSFIILCDQFSRNMFRGQAAAFATDGMCLTATARAIEKGWDFQVAEPERQFIYMPLMHSEKLADQDLAIELFNTRMPETGALSHDHTLAHRYVIEEFGRFPYRNAALGRETTPEEQEFLDAGGYGFAVRHIQANK